MVPPTSAWSDTQKAALVQQIVSGGLSLERACAEYGLSLDEIKDWVCIFRRSVRQALDRQLRSTLSLQGLEVAELSRPEFSGELRDLDVCDLVQTIQLGRKDAKITVSRGGVESYIWCEAGEVVDAECETLSGEPALYRILSMDQGSVVADFGASGRPRRIHEATGRLLLEAATRRDRRRRALGRVGDAARVFKVVSSVAARRARDLGPEELAVLSLFDGARTLLQVATATELLEHEVLEICARFQEQGVIAAAPALPAAHAAPSSGTPSMAMSYRPLAGTLQPERERLPLWVLASGAVLCSSLGAVTAVAYADAWGEPSEAGEIAAATTARASTPEVAARALCPTGMVLIRGGRFLMGSESSHPALQYARPSHPVSVDSFCLGVHEVNVREYTECVASGACEPAHEHTDLGSAGAGSVSSTSRRRHDEQCNAGKPGRELDPINCVSHGQAVGYCAFRKGRLATEAEWEFAARGENNRPFPWGDGKPTANHVNTCGKECVRWHVEVGLDSELHGAMYDEDDGYAGTAPVGSYPLGASSDGVQDLIGNVFEWTAGGLYAYDRSAGGSPKGPFIGDGFVIRGGNFKSGTLEFTDPALRFAMPGYSYSHGVGFRCASDPKLAPPDPG